MLSRCLCRFSLLLAGLLALPALVAGLPTVPLAPLAPGMQMTCQFLNQTQGERSDSQIFVLIIVRNAAGQFCWVNAAGQLIPCVSGDNTLDKFLPLSSFSALQFPATMTSGRLYLALDSPLNIQFNTAGDGSVGIAFPDINNPGDASVGHDFDWIEFAVVNNAIWCNTTQVDMFGIPLTLQLYQGGAGGYSLNSEAGVTESAQALREAFAAEVPAEFQPLVVPHRIKAPIHDALGSSGYFDAYIDAVWAQYRTADLVIPSASGTYTGRVGLDGRLAFRRPGDGATYYVCGQKPTVESTNVRWCVIYNALVVRKLKAWAGEWLGFPPA
jgi:hypothetical protein